MASTLKNPYGLRNGVVVTADVVEQILEIALSPPKRLIGMNCWSLPKLRQYLMEQRVVTSISVSWLRELLRQHRVRLRRTKTWKESSDPQFWRKYRAVRRLYRKSPFRRTSSTWRRT